MNVPLNERLKMQPELIDLPDDGAKFYCSFPVEVPKPVFWDECRKPAIGIIIGVGPRCEDHKMMGKQ